MTAPTYHVQRFISKGFKLFTAVLVLATVVPQIITITPASADTGGYSWWNAPCAWNGSTTGTCSGYDWGESTCPSNDNYCTQSNEINGYYQFDQWGEGFRNCVSYGAWKLNQVFGINTNNWGNGKDWNNSALAAHYTDDPSPQVGDIAQWNATGSNQYGHVAYVYAVNNGIASYSEYNYAADGNFLNTYTSASNSQGAPNNYIHIGNTSGGSSNPSYDLRQFSQTNGSWTSADPSSSAGVPIAGNPAPGNGGTWARDTGNHLRQFYVGSNGWTAFDATQDSGTSVSGDPAISSGGIWERGQGTNAIDGKNVDNHLVQFYIGSNGHWTYADPSGATGVNIAGNPVVTSGGIYARGMNGDLYQFYVGSNGWTAYDVSAGDNHLNMWGDPAISSGGVWIRAATSALNNHLLQLFVGSNGWTYADPSGAIGVNIASNPVVDPNGGEWATGDNNGYHNLANHLLQFYVGSSGWTYADPSGQANANITGTPAVGNGGTWARGSGGSTNNHMLQFYVGSNGWTYTDASAQASTPISLDPVVDSSGLMWAAS